MLAFSFFVLFRSVFINCLIFASNAIVSACFPKVALEWQGGNGIDELVRDFEGPNSLSALRTRLGRRDSATQFRAVSPPR